MISYNPLWITLIKKKMKKSDLYAITSSATVSRMSKDEYVSLEVIDKICTFLDCPLGDVVMRVYGFDEEKDPNK